MKPLHFIYCIAGLFLVFMAGITVYSVNAEYRQLTEVRLSFAQRDEKDKNAYSVPLSAVYTDTDGRNYLFLVLEQEGAWGKEYVCKKVFLAYAKFDESQNRVSVKEPALSKYPIAKESERILEDGERVRLSTETVAA